MDMEHVVTFTNELKTLTEVALPVSRKKMASITRAAIKALRFYKHIVQCVEKFILRCPPQLKLPGLYVIDAIVRQSKYYYQDKDVYGPRFMRNLVNVFLSVLQCDDKDKSMIPRVLYLWQRGNVFPEDVIQVLQNVVADPNNAEVVQKAIQTVANAVNRMSKLSNSNTQSTKPELIETANSLCEVPSNKVISNPVQRPTSAEMQLYQLQALQRKITEQSALLNQDKMIDPEVLSQLRILMTELTRRTEEAAMQLADGATEQEMNVIDPHLLARLQAMVDTLIQTRALQEQLNQARGDHRQHSTRSNGSFPADVNVVDAFDGGEVRDQFDPPAHHAFYRKQRERAVDTSGRGTPQSGYSMSPERPIVVTSRARDSPRRDLYERPLDLEHDENETNWTESDPRARKLRRVECIDGGIGAYTGQPLSSTSTNQSNSDAEANNNGDGAHNDNDDNSTESSPVSSVRRQSELYSSQQYSTQSLQQPLTPTSDHKRRRKHLGLPTLRSDHMGILSHTVFIGHLHKQLAESRLQALCAEVAEGPVVDCNFIPPRGCAFVTFATRRAAYRAVTQMDQSTMNGRQIKVAWAPNRGIKEHESYCRAYWDVEEGCTYLPLAEVTKLTRPQLDALLDGYGEVDEDSVADARLRDLILSPSMGPVTRTNCGVTSAGKRSGQRHHTSRNRLATSISSAALPALPQLPTLPEIVHCATSAVLRPSLPTAHVPLIVPVAASPTSAEVGGSPREQGLSAGAISLESSRHAPVGSGVFSGGFLNPVCTTMESGYVAPSPRGEYCTPCVNRSFVFVDLVLLGSR
ncbi:Protein SCAF8 [Fasciola hepatica]|uniref:Protein SCAF8 n=1 Tax=Fasciola hepatica TaxID=6192 RepID=A0A4E0S1F6_FASHE|nr:Protein SCAF8 [Fasciola hepatica]